MGLPLGCGGAGSLYPVSGVVLLVGSGSWWVRKSRLTRVPMIRALSQRSTTPAIGQSGNALLKGCLILKTSVGRIVLNHILPTLFTLREGEPRIITVMSSNVDDLLYGYLPEGAEAMNSVLQHFLVGKSTFRFRGSDKMKTLAFTSQPKDNTERVQPITYDAKHSLTRKATASEVHQSRSVTQSLAWIARQIRPDLSYRFSKIQSTFENDLCQRPA